VPNRHVSRNHHYSPDVLVEAWGLLLQSRLELPNPAQPNGPWEYDLVDVTRQVRAIGVKTVGCGVGHFIIVAC
jgi:hypothetical protein